MDRICVCIVWLLFLCFGHGTYSICILYAREVPEDSSAVSPRPGSYVPFLGAFSEIGQGSKVFHCASVCGSAENQHSLTSETHESSGPSHTVLCSAISIPYTDYKDERMSRMTTGRVGAWGFVSKSAVLCRLLSGYLAENAALATTEGYGWT